MINVTFSDSLSGSLKMADYYAKEQDRDVQDLSENIHSIYLNLSMGYIGSDELGEERRNEFIKINHDEKHEIFYGEWFDKTRKIVANLEKLAKAGERIRIWYSEAPDELCAFSWMISLLDSWGIDEDKILHVKLPNSLLFYNGDYETYSSSAMFEPNELVQLVGSQKVLTKGYKEAKIKQWKKVKEENTQLRTVLNGQIVSVYEDFYDSVILIELKKLGDVFEEMKLIGHSIVKINATIEFVAGRIDEMIDKGILEIEQEAPINKEYYCRLLRKI